MKGIRSRWLSLCLAGSILAIQITGCKRAEDILQKTAESGESAQSDTSAGDQALASLAAVGRSERTEEDGRVMVTASLGEGGEKTICYEPEDLENEWEEEGAVGIVLSEDGITAEGDGVSVSGRTAVIEKGGVYVMSGQMTEGQLRIEAGKEELVRLILKGADLSNTHTSPIYGTEGGKVVMTLAEGTKNIIRDGREYQLEAEGEEEPDAPIFINGDLTINGTGSLEVSGNYQSGIHSKDNLKVISGKITMEAVDHGLKGKNSVIIREGVLTIQAGKDGIKSNQDEDAEKGFIWIDGGEILIAAKDDGIQAETALIVCGGSIRVTESQEGLAGKTVDILGGLVKAVMDDDGINSAASVETEQEKMQDQDGVYTRIAGGEIWLNAKADGIDSNGDLYLEGGTLYLSGPVSRGDGILDYNGEAMITGGTLFAAGSSGMMQTFGEKSASNYLVIYLEKSQEAGSRICLTDEGGTILGEYAPEKEYDAMILSAPGMEEGSVYHVKIGEEEESEIQVTVTGRETVFGTSPDGRDRRGHGPGKWGNPQGRREGEERPEPPESFGGEKRPEPPEGFGGENGQEPPEGFEGEDRPEPPEGFGGEEQSKTSEGSRGRKEGRAVKPTGQEGKKTSADSKSSKEG